MVTKELITDLVETLHMLSGDIEEINALAKQESLTCEDIIQDYLNEIEGDVYTFLHHENLSRLNLSNLISNQVLDLIVTLREAVENLPKEKWKVSLFGSDDEWQEIHKKAKNILSVIPNKADICSC